MDDSLLEEVLERLKKAAGETYTSFSVPGYSEAEIAEHERSIGVKLPADLRALARTIKSMDSGGWSTDFEPNRGPNEEEFEDGEALFARWEIFLQIPPEYIGDPGDAIGTSYIRKEALAGRIHPGWAETPYFFIGNTCCFDSLYYCVLPPDREPGTILMIDDEDHTHPFGPMLILGNSLAQWLSRFLDCGCREHATYMSDKWFVSAPIERRCLEDHLSLNPGDERPAQRLERIRRGKPAVAENRQSPIGDWFAHNQMRVSEFFRALKLRYRYPGEPLRKTARNGDVDRLKELLKKGARVEAVGQGRLTALHMAAWGGHVECLRALLEAGANIEARNGHGWTALTVAATQYHDPLQTIEFLCDQDANVNAQDNRGRTALMLLSSSSYGTDQITFLIQRGADLETQDVEGRTALMHAILDGGIDEIELLLDAGANVRARDHQGETATEYVAKREMPFHDLKRAEVVELLRSFDSARRDA